MWILSRCGLEVCPQVVYRKELVSPTEGEAVRPFRELSLDDFEQQVRLNPAWFSSRKMADIRAAFAVEGNRAYGLFDGALLVCYGWVSTRRWGTLERRLRPGDAYFWDAYTHPDYRGRRLHSALAEWRSRAALQHGCATAYVIVATWNRASRRTYERNGYSCVARYVDWRVGCGPWKSTFKYPEP